MYAIRNRDGSLYNKIESDEEFAKQLAESLEGTYEPEGELQVPKSTLESLEEENKILKAQLKAQEERSDFIEDCIAEMAMEVYKSVW